MSDLALLLGMLDRGPDERLSVCYQLPGSPFRSEVTTVAQAPMVADRFAGRADVWYGTAVLRPGVASGRGTAADVIGVRELYADLDVKAGGMPGWKEARSVVDDLSAMLGTAPAALVMSGHGLQPHWVLERDDDTDWPGPDDPRHAAAAELWRRWHALVTRVAKAHGGAVDNVSDLSRVLRAPGTTNLKDPALPVPVTLVSPGGAPVSLGALHECLDAHGEEARAHGGPRTLDLAPTSSPGVPGIGAPITTGHDVALRDFAASVVARYPGAPLEELVPMVVRRGQDCVPSWASGMKPGDQTLEEAARDRWLPSAIKKYARPAREAGLARSAASADVDAPGARKLRVQRASELTQRASRWLWQDGGAHWLPLGGLTLLGGREGIGKSTWGYRLAAQVTQGTLPGDLFGRPSSVIVAATEDAWEQTILPRLVAAGAECSRVLRVDVEESGAMSGLVLPTDTAAVAELCRDEGVGLILLDPLLGTVSGRLDTHKDAEVRQALEPLSRLAHDCRLSVVGLIHENKGQGADLLTRLMGSRAFAAVARAVLVCAEEKSELQESDFGDVIDLGKGTRRTFLFGQEKNNLGPRVEHSIRYEIEGSRTGYDEELSKEIWSSRIGVLGIADERVGELVARQESEGRPGKGRPSTERDAAATWLRGYLTAAGCGVPSQQVVAMGKAAGHSDKTVRRAAAVLGVKPIRQPDMTTVWLLEEAS